MQPNLESGMPGITPQILFETQEVLSENEKPRSQLAELISEKNVLYKNEHIKSSRGILQMSRAKRQHEIGGRQRPSPRVWHFILVMGDMILLMALFVPLLFFPPVTQVFWSTLEIWNIKLIWVSLALASWCLVVNVTGSQNLSYASSRFRSSFCTLFALVLMNILWIVLSFLLLGIGFVAQARLQLLFFVLAIPVFTIWRVLLAEVMHLPHFLPRAVIVGVNSAGEAVAKELQSARHPSANILGYIGENVEEGSYHNDLHILGGRDVLRYLAKNGMIDMIIVALDYRADSELFKETIDAVQFGISVLPMSVVFESSTGKIPVEHVGDQWYVALQPERILSPLYLCWKEALDLVCGVCGLLVLCLTLPVIALFIYLDSPGPIFYSQERVGLRGKAFRIYKFRSMHPDAEGEGRAIWAAEGDERVTRVGRFLRATHLDELPQLFNILRGEMSLIGPRPERAEFISKLEQTIPFYRHRLTIKPGLTGWAQVKFRYGRTGNDALIKLQYDLYYIKRQSFMLDIFIVLMTVIEVVLCHGT